MDSVIQTIQSLSNIPGVPGDEGAVRDEIINITNPHCEYEIDPLGNLLAFKKGPKSGPRIMLSAHMDEVGLIITHIEQDGLLRCAPVGSIDSRVAFGRAVEIGKDRLPGVIGGVAVHHLTTKEKKAPPEWDKLLIDIGARDAREAAQHVAPGDRAVFASEFARLGEDYIIGRALDNRAGCALLIELIRTGLPCDCHFAFTVQEETGCVGGGTAAHTLRPDFAIVVETTTAADIPDTPTEKQVCKLGGGPVLSFMDKGALYDRELYSLAHQVARQRGIPCQSKSLVAGGNESRTVQMAGGGVRVLAVSMPCRYLHSPNLVLHRSDIENTLTLLSALAQEIAKLGASR